MTDDEWANLAKELIRAVQDNDPNVADWISAVSTALTLLIAVVAAVFARGQLVEASKARKQTKKLELEKSQPYVVAYLEENGVGAEILDLVVKNFGQTAGRDVHLAFDPVLNRTETTGGEQPVGLPEVISFLAPGQEWRTVFDVMNERATRDDMPLTYKGVVTYEGIDGEALSSDVVIDLRPYKARIYTQVFGVHHAARALRDIRDNQKKWTEGTPGGLKVYSRDGDAKDEALVREAQEYRRQRAAEEASNPTQPRRRVQHKEPEEQQ